MATTKFWLFNKDFILTFYNTMQYDVLATIISYTGVFIISQEDCLPGKYNNGSTCLPCPIGEYQNEALQTECKKCSAGMTTNHTGAKNASDCICK